MTDAYGPFSTGPVHDSFLMPIEDIFNIKQRGIVVTGRIERGMVHVGDSIEIVGMKEPIRQAVVRGLEMFRKLLTVAQAGNNVGCLLDGIQPTDLERGQVLASIGSIKAYKKFSAQVQMNAQEDGGRHTPFFEGYRPSIHIRSVDILGSMKFPYGMQRVEKISYDYRSLVHWFRASGESTWSCMIARVFGRSRWRVSNKHPEDGWPLHSAADAAPSLGAGEAA